MFNKFFLFVLFVNLYPNLFNCQEYDNQAYLNLLKTDSSIQKLYLPHLNDYLYYIDLILNDTNRNISDKCENDLLHLKEGLLKKEEFALNCKSLFKFNFKLFQTDLLICNTLFFVHFSL